MGVPQNRWFLMETPIHMTIVQWAMVHGVSILSPGGKLALEVPDVQAITSSGEVAEENAYLGRFLMSERYPKMGSMGIH